MVALPAFVLEKLSMQANVQGVCKRCKGPRRDGSQSRSLFAIALSEASARPQVFLYGLYAGRFTAADVIAATRSSTNQSQWARNGG